MIDYENKKIAVEWNVDDVKEVLEWRRERNWGFKPALTDDEMFQALVYCEEHLVATHGINWDAINDALFILYRDREVRLASIGSINQALEAWRDDCGCVLKLSEKEKQCAADYFNEHYAGTNEDEYWEDIDKSIDALYKDREVFAK